MQTRNFFTFGPLFNILVDPVIASQPKNNTPTETVVFLTTEDDQNYITENSNFLITE